MSQLNEQMAALLDTMSTTLTEKLMEVIEDLSPADKARLQDQLATYEEDCADYRELLATDQVKTSPTDLISMQSLLRRIEQADAADIIDLVDELLEFIEDKFNSAGFATRSVGVAAGPALLDDDDLLGLNDEWDDDDDDDDDSAFDVADDSYFDDDDY